MPKSKQAVAEDLAKRLPAPFDDIRFAWGTLDRFNGVSDAYVMLEYIGAPDRLIECGAIEPAMAGKARTKSRPRVDSAGHYYHRDLQVDRNSMTNVLKITRCITDPKFAETLPGAPRGLRFKRLDWLDVHPDKVHVVSKRREYANRTRWVETITAGTLDNLLASGFSETFFKLKKFTPASPSHYLYEVRRENAYGRVTRLMRGYFEVRMETLENHEDDAPVDETPAPRLRLVVNNSRPAIPQDCAVLSEMIRRMGQLSPKEASALTSLRERLQAEDPAGDHSTAEFLRRQLSGPITPDLLKALMLGLAAADMTD
jgi:hypothetical protein